MSIAIRAVKEGDRQTWQGLWEQYNAFYKRTVPTNVTDKTFSRFLDDQTRIFCAVAELQEGEGREESSPAGIIGFVHWYPHPSTSAIDEAIYLHDLFVDPSVRNQGVGRKLIEHVYDYARSIEADNVYWHTQYFNHRAQLLYTKVATRTDFVMYQKTF